jgi:hypothetical protein
MRIGRGKSKYSEKTCPSSTFSITNHGRIGPEPNSDPHVENLVEVYHTEENIRTTDSRNRRLMEKLRYEEKDFVLRCGAF